MLGLTAAHNSNYYTADNGYVHDTICGLISECITMHAVYLIVYSTHCSRYCTSVQCRHKAGQYSMLFPKRVATFNRVIGMGVFPIVFVGQ